MHTFIHSYPTFLPTRDPNQVTRRTMTIIRQTAAGNKQTNEQASKQKHLNSAQLHGWPRIQLSCVIQKAWAKSQEPFSFGQKANALIPETGRETEAQLISSVTSKCVPRSPPAHI